MGVNRPIRPQHREFRQDLHQIPELVHRAPAQILESELVAILAILEESLVSRRIAGRQACHLGAHRIGILPRGKAAAIGPADFVEGINRAQIDILVEIAPAGLPKLAKDLWNRDNGRPQIKAVAVLPDAGSAPAGAVKPVQHGDAVALGPKPHGRSQTAQTSTYYDRMRPLCGLCGLFHFRIKTCQHKGRLHVSS